MASEEEKTDLKRWIEGWRTAGLVMEDLRRKDLHHIDIGRIIEEFDDAFEASLLHFPTPRSSGLVEQQAWFSKLRK